MDTPGRLSRVEEARRARDQRHQRARASVGKLVAQRTAAHTVAEPEPQQEPAQDLDPELGSGGCSVVTARRAPPRRAPPRAPPRTRPQTRSAPRRKPPQRPPPRKAGGAVRRTATSSVVAIERVDEDDTGAGRQGNPLAQQVLSLQQQLADARQDLERTESQRRELLARLEGTDEEERPPQQQQPSPPVDTNAMDNSREIISLPAPAMERAETETAAALREQVALLQSQLRAAGIDNSDWDGTLEAAQEGLREAMERLMAGDAAAEPAYEKWARRVSTHPTHLAAEKRRLAEWDAKERPKRAAALAFLRRIVPADIERTTRSSLQQREGMTEPLLLRLWEKRVLWFVRMHTQAVAKIHKSDLKSKFSYQGCDITECRAVFTVLPERFEGDEGGEKLAWRDGLRERLVELSEREAAGTLSADDAQSAAYRSITTPPPPPPPSAGALPPPPPAASGPPPPPSPPSQELRCMGSTGRGDLLAAIQARRID